MNRNSTVVILLCWFWSFCGCDDVPSFEASNSDRAIKQPKSWTSENGRGGYEWKLNQQGQLPVPIPPMFPFLSELASQPKQTTLWPVKSANQEPWHRPDWMSDEVHEIFRRFTEPASKELLLHVPSKQISHTLAFDLNRNGQTLATLNDGKIELYDLNPLSPPQSFPSPLTDAYGILTTSSKNKFYLCNSKSIALVELPEAKVLAKVESRFPVNHWEKASERDNLMVVTTDNVMAVFDSELKLVDQCFAFEDASGFSSSFNSGGEYVLAVGPNHLFHWTPSIPKSPLSFAAELPGMNSIQSVPQSNHVITGKRFDCVWNSNSLTLISKPSDQDRSKLGSVLFVTHNLDDLKIRSFGLDANDSYLICAKQNTTENTAPEYLAFDFGTPSASNFVESRIRRSKSISLGAEPIKRLMTDQSGRVLVMLRSSGLTVLKRTPWMGPPDASLCHDLASTLLASNDFAQLERCAQELRSRDWPEHELWGEQVYRCFVQQVGLATSNSSSDKLNREQLSKWLDTGGELAVLSRAFHSDFLALWRGLLRIEMRNDFGGTSIPQNERPERLRSFESQLDTILNGPDAPALAFWIKMHLVRMRAKSIAEFEPILKRCLELYPYQLNLHKQLVVHMMSGSGPGSLPTQAYVSAIARSFSKELVDEATVLMMSELSPEQWQFVFASDEWLKEQEQIERTVTKWIRADEQNKIETFFRGQSDLKKSLKKTGIDQYYERTFPFGL